MGGGGHSSLNDPISPVFPQENVDELDDETEKIEYTYKTYDDYFTDLDISPETITEEDLTGIGSATDPYIVNSTRGFIFLTNTQLSKKYLFDGYLQLNCDVYLNDETFDEEGNPSGGDGKVYSWDNTRASSNLLKFNGQGHTIYGLYCNDTTKTNISMFGGYPSKIENLNMKEIFIKAKGKVSPLASDSVTEVRNVNTYGTILAEGSASGIDLNPNSRSSAIENCNNYVNIRQIDLGSTGSANFSGISTYARIKNCNNYASITAFSVNYAGGLLASLSSYAIDCNNYGKIECVQFSRNSIHALGGIIGGNHTKNATVENCNNYGEVSVYKFNYTGGIIGYFLNNTIVKNCKNFGKLNKCASIAGGGYGGNQYLLKDCINYGNITDCSVFIIQPHTNTIIDGCINYGNVTTSGLIGLISRSVRGYNYTINNCKIYGNVSSSNTNSTLGLIGDGLVGKNLNLTISNLYCDVSYDSMASKICLLNYGATEVSGNVLVKNSKFNITVKSQNTKDLMISERLKENLNMVFENVEFNNTYAHNTCMSFFNWFYGTATFNKVKITEKCSSSPIIKDLAWLSSTKERFKESYLSIVREISSPDGNTNIYYGSEFSGFYVSWRTGKVGLKTLNVIGQFQGEVTEQVLEGKRYQKREI